MIKELKKKFIVTAMTAITILIVVVLGTVNAFNIIIASRENHALLDTLAIDEGIPEFDNHGAFVLEDDSAEDSRDNVPDEGGTQMSDGGEIPDDDVQQDEAMKGRKEYREIPRGISEDDVKSTRFFIVRIDTQNEIVYKDVENISSVSDEEAEEYAKKVIAKDKTEGRIGSFIYKVSASKDGLGKTIVFLMTSQTKETIISVALISIGIGIISWLIMLVIVIVLSSRAIKPISENIERQKQFVTDAGHEIKTPLAIILANADALELHNGESKWSKNIKSQTVRLSGLMKELLSLSKMEEGSVKPKPVDVDVSGILREQVDAFTESAAQRGITFDPGIKGGVHVKADKEHILQLINILLDNAVKYAAADTEINISLTGTTSSMSLRVSNKCENIPDTEPQKLFDRFYRADASRSKKTGGYGIGLSIARAIAETYGGSIKCEFSNTNDIIFSVKL